jgi:hypothetical protein
MREFTEIYLCKRSLNLNLNQFKQTESNGGEPIDTVS